MSEQLELDLVTIEPAAPAESERLKARAAELLSQSRALNIMALACAEFDRLSRMDCPLNAKEITELAVLVGSSEWKKRRRFWERRSRRDPRQVRRYVLGLRTFYQLSKLKTEK